MSELVNFYGSSFSKFKLFIITFAAVKPTYFHRVLSFETLSFEILRSLTSSLDSFKEYNMCQHHIIHVNNNPGRGLCSSMDHCYCVSKWCESKLHFSTSHGPQLAVESGERGYSFENGDINCLQDITSTKQLFLPWARKTGWLGQLNARSGCDYSIQNITADPSYSWHLHRTLNNRYFQSVVLNNKWVNLLANRFTVISCTALTGVLFLKLILLSWLFRERLMWQ